MGASGDWADNYAVKRRTAKEAVGLIRSGKRVFIGSSCGEPQHLVQHLAEASDILTDLEIVRLLTLERTPLTLMAGQTKRNSFDIRSFYLGSARPRRLAENKRFITPINLSAIPLLFKSRRLPVHVALIQVSPPDDFGWMSLGVSVDITLAAAQSADLVIAQVNPKMPRVLGRSFIHVNDVDVIVEHEEDLIALDDPPELESGNVIGRIIASLIDDGATIQISLGTTLKATLSGLAEKNDLGIHTQFLTDDLMHLYARGVITNRKKGFNEGKLVASSAVGSKKLYEFIHDNPGIEFHPSDYVNDPSIIARHSKMVSMNVAMAMDLTGQAAADALPYNHFSGVTGMLDFIRGASQCEDGKSILMLPSTNADGKKSRIVPFLRDAAVVVPRGDVHYVVTEYGAVNLFGKSLQERALAMISIAHPDFRDELFHEAKKAGLLAPDLTRSQSLQAVYPIQLEEARDIDGEIIRFRPAKPVDGRRIQEHYYNMDKGDIVSRFYHEKASFIRDEIANISQIDYVNEFTIVAITGDFGFGKIVGVGEYLLNPAKNVAEVAFSVNKAYQAKGIGKLLLGKLAAAARDNGILGLMAYTSTKNHAMIRLFMSLPYKIKTFIDGDIISLRCRFDEKKHHHKESSYHA
ncbi:MAG: GNAT family N-acetyltransferase [Desulfobacterales bacterium]|nr:GNAT family N-acetyltransferase [Desulfobacterales bacterium]